MSFWISAWLSLRCGPTVNTFAVPKYLLPTGLGNLDNAADRMRLVGHTSTVRLVVLQDVAHGLDIAV
ncbi:hypothetical protein CK231_22170 [Mesorhizobium loti]|nr:hypothetical protein CK231_22170 [Mesorhizobium loti]